MLNTPQFWQSKYSLWSLLLLPLSWFYQLGNWFKAMFCSKYTSQLPIISVGNINAGGTGKTPVCIEIGKILRDNGFNIAFLTRGYGGEATAVEVVNRKRHTVQEVGDEALLLSEVADTFVFKNKILGLRTIESKNTYDVVVLDDGLQSYNIVKDFNVLVLNGEYGLGNGRILPAGPLRQHLSTVQHEINMVVINGLDVHNLREQFSTEDHIFNSYVRTDKKRATKKDHDVIAFSGIGRPERFFHTLSQELNYNIVKEMIFPDHYYFTAEDMDELIVLANNAKAKLITTEKDWQRIPTDYQRDIEYTKIFLEFDAPDEFNKLIVTSVSLCKHSKS